MFALLLAAWPIAATAEVAPEFEVHGTAEKPAIGRLQSLTGDFSVKILSELGESSVKNAYSIRRHDRQLPPMPTGPQLISTTGDRIAGTLLGGDSKNLIFLPAGLGLKFDEAWKVPISSTAVVWLAATPADTPRDPARYDWLTGNRNRDVLRFRNGDVERGTLVGLDPEIREPVVAFRAEQGAQKTIPGDKLAAIAFNPALARTRKPKGAYARLTLANSSRLEVQNPSISAGSLSGETLFGLKVSIPLVEILSLDVINGKATFLSDLKPKKVEQSGFLSVAWPWMADRTANGLPLQVLSDGGKSTFDKGLGTHARCELTYDLGGKFSRFETLVALDSEATVRGEAIVRIAVDGQDRSLPALLPLKTGVSVPVRLDIRGARELTLLTDFGRSGGVGADVNWCDARLVE